MIYKNLGRTPRILTHGWTLPRTPAGLPSALDSLTVIGTVSADGRSSVYLIPQCFLTARFTKGSSDPPTALHDDVD